MTKIKMFCFIFYRQREEQNQNMTPKKLHIIKE